MEGNYYPMSEQSEKLSTCEGSGDVVLDLDVDKESRQSERHVTLTAQADVMKPCRTKKKTSVILKTRTSHETKANYKIANYWRL